MWPGAAMPCPGGVTGAALLAWALHYSAAMSAWRRNSSRVRMRRMRCPCCGKYAWVVVGPRKVAAEIAYDSYCWTSMRKAP
jgi:hypothetical protein